jgi:hypothetical protein
MLRIIGFCLALLTLTVSAQAQDNSAIEGVIARQLDAFNARDTATAWTFASPTIKGIFRTPENFGLMVQNGYPMVWTNSDVRFLDLREIAGAEWQRVMLRDAEGNLHVLDYKMIETPDGWQIDAVVLIPAPDVGA